jgi:hypothetical protein
VRDSIRDILIAESELTAIVPEGRIWTRPLVRPGSSDPLDIGFEPTPEAFDDVAPFWLKSNIVVGSRITRIRDRNRRRADNQTARWGVTLAYYVPPDGESLLTDISWCVSVALGRDESWITIPGSRKARAVVPHDISASVPVPEFPDAGFVMLERIEIPTVWIGR